MTKKNYILPMIDRTVFFIVYPGFELLDLSGPMSVFAAANSLSQQTLYAIKTLSPTGGNVSSGAGLSIVSESLRQAELNGQSTALVVGADAAPLVQAVSDQSLSRWLAAELPKAERFGSICSGTFLLEKAGLLTERTVTTHWAACQPLKKLNPALKVLEDALYHQDGKCWTSAGVTTGIDMALEMIKRDHGQDLMQAVARGLVVYAQRPGKQSQFSQMLDMKPNQEDLFSDLIRWLKQEVSRAVKVSEMADFMRMSERSFQRRFTAHFAVSPARFFERMRMEYARDFLLPKHSIEKTARELGYRSVAAFRTGFEKNFGISPAMSRQIR